MEDELVIGVDVGSFSTKGVLCTPDGRIVASHVVEHRLSVPQPGWAEHDADTVWWDGCAAVCRALVAAAGCPPSRVRALAVSAVGPAVLPVDKDGRPLRPAILYGIDTRAYTEIVELTGRFGEGSLVEYCGSTLTAQAAGPKILWVRRHEPDIFARAARFLGATAYLVWRLTGEIVMDTYTASAYTPLFDLRGGAWSDRFAEPICSLDRLPPTRWSAEIVGGVTARAAVDTNLAVGTPVTVGTIDAMAEAISVGATRPGDLMLMYGTTTMFLFVAPALLIDRRLWAYSHALPGLHTLVGGMPTTGALARWIRDIVGSDLVMREGRGGPNAFEKLDREAVVIKPGSEGLVLLPYFSGQLTPVNDPLARGVVAGLSLAHRRGHLYRAALEGIAYGIRHNLEVMRAAGANITRIVAVGGGTQSHVWRQIVSDVTGLHQELPEQGIGAAYGDAFLAAFALGLVPDLDALATSWTRISDRVDPHPEHNRVYEPYYKIYRDLYDASIGQQHALSALAAQERDVGHLVRGDDSDRHTTRSERLRGDR